MSRRSSPRIVRLLPTRNVASQLPAWLDAASAFADAVVALDDGSTDDTGAVRAAHPLVATVLANEQRIGHLGWHDGRNRNRLLAASAALEPDWIMSLDADERLDRDDAKAIRRFVAHEALPGCAYGLQVHRMQAEETYDLNYEWVYRLFAFREGQRFVNRRIDLVPVPAVANAGRNAAEFDVAPASFVREQVLALGGFDDNAVGGLDEGVCRTLLADGFTATTVRSVTRSCRTPPKPADLLWRFGQRVHRWRRRGAAALTLVTASGSPWSVALPAARFLGCSESSEGRHHTSPRPAANVRRVP